MYPQLHWHLEWFLGSTLNSPWTPHFHMGRGGNFSIHNEKVAATCHVLLGMKGSLIFEVKKVRQSQFMGMCGVRNDGDRTKHTSVPRMWDDVWFCPVASNSADCSHLLHLEFVSFSCHRECQNDTFSWSMENSSKILTCLPSHPPILSHTSTNACPGMGQGRGRGGGW